MISLCDCGDYCDWCHPELCFGRREEVSNEIYDKLLEYAQEEKDKTAKKIKKSEALKPEEKEYLRGRFIAFLDIISFLLTDGRLT